MREISSVRPLAGRGVVVEPRGSEAGSEAGTCHLCDDLLKNGPELDA